MSKDIDLLYDVLTDLDYVMKHKVVRVNRGGKRITLPLTDALLSELIVDLYTKIDHHLLDRATGK